MKNIILLFPWIFFFLAFYFRLKDNSFFLFEKYNLKVKKKYAVVIPISELKENIKQSRDVKMKSDLERCLKHRKYFWYAFSMLFVSIFLIGYFQ